MKNNIIHQAKFWKPSLQEDIVFYKGHFNTFEFDKHVHDEYTITLVQDGRMNAFLDGFSKEYNKSAILTINPDQIHACKTKDGEGYKYNSIYFNKSVIEKISKDEFNCKEIFFDKSSLENKEIYQKLSRLVIMDELGQISKLDFECNFIEVLKDILKLNTNISSDIKLSSHDTMIKRAKEFINDNFALDLSLDDISKHLDISKYHFLRLFKDKTYISPHSYLMLRRVEKAKQFLQNGESLINTAYLCGFNDQSHLHRRFKSLVGITPKNYQNFFI
jgi:AraC-like DNA-binding protein